MSEIFKKQKSISKLKEGDNVEDIFIIKIKKSVTSYIKGFYFGLILTDESGLSLEWKYWGENQREEDVTNIFNQFKVDDVVLIKKGIITKYNDKLQLGCNKIEDIKILKPEEYEADFIPSTTKDIGNMFSQLQEKINLIENPELKKFIVDIFIDQEIQNKFKLHPSAITIHHSFKGGLLEHTLEVIKFCEASIELYPELDKDLLLAGAILHDIGKLEELEMTGRIKGSRKGQLLGHLTLGVMFLNKKLDEGNLDDLLKEKLLHILISSHGKLEFGSPKEPMMKEAIALYYADELSSKLNEVIKIIENNKDKTEDDFVNIPRLGKNILLR